jgi:hypothetical protein
MKEEQERKSPNRKGICHDRKNRRKRENNIYTIMTILTLMNCIQNDAGHNKMLSDGRTPIGSLPDPMRSDYPV